VQRPAHSRFLDFPSITVYAFANALRWGIRSPVFTLSAIEQEKYFFKFNLFQMSRFSLSLALFFQNINGFLLTKCGQELQIF